MAAAGLVAMLAEVAMRLLEPWPVQVVIDAVVPASVEGARTDPSVGRTITLAAVATLGIVAARAAAAFFSTVIFAVVGSRVTRRSAPRSSTTCWPSRCGSTTVAVRVISSSA
jgi:ATP-binding cassette subfamily B protein